MGFAGFPEAERHPQHAEAFTILLAEVLVVDLVGLADGGEVGVLGVAEPTEPTVDEHVVDEEVTQTIRGNAGANPKPEVCVGNAGDDAPGTGQQK